jgi:hypothetical protein
MMVMVMRVMAIAVSHFHRDIGVKGAMWGL